MPILNELSELSGETAVLAVCDHGRRARMYVATSPSRRSVRFVPELFRWLPLHAAASAMVILAFSTEIERRTLFEEGLPIFTGERVSWSKLDAIYAAIRSNGYAVSRDQADVGASAVGAPVATKNGIQCSIAVSVPNQRFESAIKADLIQHVLWAAGLLGRRLGDPMFQLAAG
jgi:DNA-binding IclR family transcriptional regulator